MIAYSSAAIQQASQQRYTAANRPKPPRVIERTIKPLPWQAVAIESRAETLLLTGAAGGGKSIAASEMIHNYMLTYQNAVGLVMRKTRVNAKRSVAMALKARAKAAGMYGREIEYKSSLGEFHYHTTGSICYVAGMADEDQKEALRSINGDGSVDIVWMEEANSFDEADFNEVGGRMRGTAAPYQQVILSTNPDHHLHWIRTRLILGDEAEVHISSYLDNEHNPDAYNRRLQLLTGYEKKRLVDGIWSTPSGLVYLTWSEDENVTEAAEYVPGGGPVYWAIDDGYSAGSKGGSGINQTTKTFEPDAHPRVILFIQERADGSWNQFDELCLCNTLEEIQIKEALERPYPKPEYIAIDSSAAQLRNRLNQLGIYSRKATHQVEEGIKELRRNISPDENGWRRYKVHPRCRHTRAEAGSYRYNEDTGKPVKEFDHCMDAARYFVWTKRHE